MTKVIEYFETVKRSIFLKQYDEGQFPFVVVSMSNNSAHLYSYPFKSFDCAKRKYEELKNKK